MKKIIFLTKFQISKAIESTKKMTTHLKNFLKTFPTKKAQKTIARYKISQDIFTKYNLEQYLMHIKKSSKHREKYLDCNRPYKCGECESFFKNITAMKQHKFTHQNIRPHIYECRKAFKKKNHLKNHELTQSRPTKYF